MFQPSTIENGFKVIRLVNLLTRQRSPMTLHRRSDWAMMMIVVVNSLLHAPSARSQTLTWPDVPQSSADLSSAQQQLVFQQEPAGPAAVPNFNLTPSVDGVIGDRGLVESLTPSPGVTEDVGPSAVPNVSESAAVDGVVPSTLPSADDDADAATEAEPLPDDASDIEKLSAKLADLQSEWDEYQKGIAKVESAKLLKSNYKLTGRVHMDYWNFAETDPGINVLESRDFADQADIAERQGLDPEDRFLFRRLRLELAGEVPNNMIFRMQVDFNRPSIPEIKDAYIGWTNLPNNQTLVLGNQKRPLGLDHLNSSRFNVFAERPLAVEAFNEDARRIGLTMYGHADDESGGWAYGIYNLQNVNTSGRYIGDTAQLGGYGRIFASPWYDQTSGGRGYWHTALVGAVAKPDGDSTEFDRHDNEGRFRTRPLARSTNRWLDTGRIDNADWFQIFGVENMVNIGSLQITSEYFLTPLQRDDPALPEEDLFFHGGYIFASYFLTGEHIPYKRTSGVIDRVVPHENFFLVDRCKGGTGRGWGAWQVALRYDHLDLSDNDVQGGVGNMITAGLNWHWTAYSKVQNNLIWGDIDESQFAGPTEGGEFWIYGARFMLDF